MQAGIQALFAGDASVAALHFSLALRLVPDAAQAILDLIGDLAGKAIHPVFGVPGGVSKAREIRTAISGVNEKRPFRN